MSSMLEFSPSTDNILFNNASGYEEVDIQYKIDNSNEHCEGTSSTSLLLGGLSGGGGLRGMSVGFSGDNVLMSESLFDLLEVDNATTVNIPCCY